MFDLRVWLKIFITSLKNLFSPTRRSNTSNKTNYLSFFSLLNQTIISIIGICFVSCRIIARRNFSKEFNDKYPVNYPEWKEIRIPTEYGHIAGKSYGDPETGIPLLGIHGWLDNCGTFDPLAGRLPPGFHFVSIDMPGHGLSSHIPPGMFYRISDGLITIKHITNYLKWPKFGILGHSMGAGLGNWYAGSFPDEITRLIQIDLINFPPMPFHKHSRLTKNAILESIKTK